MKKNPLNPSELQQSPSSGAQTDSVSDILCQLIAVPSVNPMGRELTGPDYLEEKLSDWLVDFFSSIQADHERIEVEPGRPNVIACYHSPDSDITILIDAHQDTVPVDGMTIAPFEPTLTSGKITGRGACDVKGGMAAALQAFRRLTTEKPTGAANVILSCTCDEEATTIGVRNLVESWQAPSSRSRLITSPPDAAIVIEPTELDLVVAHKGVVRFRIITNGRACHSSEPTQGENAIYKMSRVVAALEQYASQLGQQVQPHPLCGEATLSVGIISGGSSVNIVPDLCAIEIDRRLLPGENVEQVLEDIQSFIKSHVQFDVEFESPWIASPALNNKDNGWLADSFSQCIKQIDGEHCQLGVPYCTHASPISAAGVPCVVFGPGSIEQAHTKDEFIEIESLEKAAEVYYQFITNPPTKPAS